jgi:hypothetical protein
VHHSVHLVNHYAPAHAVTHLEPLNFLFDFHKYQEMIELEEKLKKLEETLKMEKALNNKDDDVLGSNKSRVEITMPQVLRPCFSPNCLNCIAHLDVSKKSSSDVNLSTE